MYENLVLSGGAIYGYTYLGALKLLEKKGLRKHFKRFAGTSVGSAIAAFIACGGSYKLIEEEMLKLDTEALKDSSCFLRDFYRLIKKYGYYKGDRAMFWITEILKKITGNGAITFHEAYEKYGTTLVIVGTSLKEKRAHYFSYINHPDMEIRQAIRISISIPLVYKAVKWNNDVWVDGGIVDNFPICYFDSDNLRVYSCWDGNCSTNDYEIDNRLHSDDYNVDKNLHKTIGLKPYSHDDYYNNIDNVTNIRSYVDNLLDTILQQASRTPLNKFNQERTVRINAGKISSMNFDLSYVEKVDLILRGEKAMEDFIKNNPGRFVVGGVGDVDSDSVDEGGAGEGGVGEDGVGEGGVDDDDIEKELEEISLD